MTTIVCEACKPKADLDRGLSLIARVRTNNPCTCALCKCEIGGKKRAYFFDSAAQKPDDLGSVRARITRPTRPGANVNERQIEIAKELAAHDRWEWLPGMRWLSDGRDYTPTGRVQGYADDHFGDAPCPDDGDWPDITDAATAGALWAVLRKLAGDNLYTVSTEWSHVDVEVNADPWVGDCLGEALALGVLDRWSHLGVTTD